MFNYFLPPKAGDSVSVICTNKGCGYIGSGKLAGLPGTISHVLKNRKCPVCKKHSLIKNPFIRY